jgi:hypothetical protein
MGDGWIFLKTAVTLPLIKIYQMSLILIGSILLDSTFKAVSVAQLTYVKTL